MLPFLTVNCLKLLFQLAVVPSTMVPPLEPLHPLNWFREPQKETVAIITVPSGTALPAESLIPEKVTVPWSPLLMDKVVGPLAVAEVDPCKLTEPTPMAWLSRKSPLLFKMRTMMLAVWV